MHVEATVMLVVDASDGHGDVDVVGGLFVATVGLALTNGVALTLGFAAKRLHDAVDVPLYERLNARGDNSLTDVLETVTKMGNERPTQLVAAVGGVLLAVWFASRRWRWWIPLMSMPIAWIGARGFQLVHTRLVNRERGVLALTGDEIGGYPSGGVARTILISGLIVFFIAYYADVSRLAVRLMFGVVAILGAVEAFARFRLNQHWFTDVIGGAFFGVLLLFVAMATVRAFDPSPRDSGYERDRSVVADS